MTEYEHKVVCLPAPKSPLWSTTPEAVRSWKDSDATTIEERLNELSREGWELVAMSVDSHGGILNIWSMRRVTMVLRRPKR